MNGDFSRLYTIGYKANGWIDMKTKWLKQPNPRRQATEAPGCSVFLSKSASDVPILAHVGSKHEKEKRTLFIAPAMRLIVTGLDHEVVKWRSPCVWPRLISRNVVFLCDAMLSKDPLCSFQRMIDTPDQTASLWNAQACVCVSEHGHHLIFLPVYCVCM